MWFYSVLFFSVLAILSIGYFFNMRKLCYWLSALILIVVSAFKPAASSKDYSFYVDYYDNVKDIPFTFLEPSYYVISEISKLLFHGPIGVFIIYSILGVTLKGIAFIKLSKYYLVSMVLYVGSFFLLHEMTQIRVGVAAAILLLSIPSIVERKLWHFLGYMLIGTLFHYSLMLFAFVYFLNAEKLNPKIYLSVIFLTFAAALVGFNLASFFQLIRLGFITDKLNAYKALLDEGVNSDIKLINPLLFLRMIVLSFFAVNWKTLQEKNTNSVMLIKIYAFSIFFFVAFADLPVLAGRTSQLFGIVEIVLVPFVLYILNPKYLALAIAIVFGVLIFYKQLYYSNLVDSYF